MRERRARAETLLRIQQERIPHLFIGGLDVESESNATIPVVNPATQEPVGRVPAANQRDVEKAVASARRAFDERRGTHGPADRASFLWQLAEAVEREAADLAILETLQTGKPFRAALDDDVLGAVRTLRAFAGWTGKRAGEVHELGNGVLGLVHWEPYPVIAAVLPWSRPFAAAVEKVAVALAIGSSTVLLPPAQAPLTVLRLSELIREIGGAAGTVNVITGQARAAGEALALAGEVSVLAYGGPLDLARRAMVGAAKSNLKRVHLQLGNKNAGLVFEDADVADVARSVVRAVFSSRAAEPTTIARLLVHESRYEAVASAVTARAKEIVIGDPLDEHTELGPVIDAEHLDRVLKYIELGRREGAKLVAGGRRDTEGTRTMGFYVKPTVFVDVRPSMRIAREDIAGPVLVMMPFRHEEEAVAIANDTDYGMVAAVWTHDLARAHRVASHLDVGAVAINRDVTRDPAIPLGGGALSGPGHDLGRAVLDLYCRPKSVVLGTR